MDPNLDLRQAQLGAWWSGSGVKFSLYSENASFIELCLFRNQADDTPSTCIPLQRLEGSVWQTFVDNAKPGSLYSYRVHGPAEPSKGHRFDPTKFLIDPYARAITADPGVLRIRQKHLPPKGGTPTANRDAAKCVVVDPSFDWSNDKRPLTSWTETVLYECHVRGMTMRHPQVPDALRGTYLGLAHNCIIEHLLSLGVTAIELLPVQQIASEPHLTRQGLTNYFGYSPIGLFAPHSGYATESEGYQVREFQQMVKKYHSAGIEVILDIVLNHTAEGDEDGPLLSLRGVDNSTYYRLDPDDRSSYLDFTGCGNSLNLDHPMIAKLALDCLRYWAEEMHVDGFRIDLATSLGRTADGFSLSAPVFEGIRQDPVLSDLKWIAEPWDVGPDGYRLGEFPADWAEWNDRYRDTLRSVWRGDRQNSASVVDAFAGSPSIFRPPSRGPESSINFITCHDGFTLADQVSYEQKHNFDNGEDNRDGWNHNLSRNWGMEGPTTDPQLSRTRNQVRRVLMASLTLSAGVPMLSHGDELSRTQSGNNNAYCQDNETTWLDWDLGLEQKQFLEFTRAILQFRSSILKILSPKEGSPSHFSIVNLTYSYPRSITLSADSSSLDTTMQFPLGIYIESNQRKLLYVLNPSPENVLIDLPCSRTNCQWKILFHSSDARSSNPRDRSLTMKPHSLVVLEET